MAASARHLFLNQRRQRGRTGAGGLGRLVHDGQRRFQRVGQVARLGARPLHDLGVAVQHAVEVVDQRLQLGGEATLQALRAAFPHVRQRAPERPQRGQAHAHLRQGRHDQQGAQRGQRGGQHAGEPAHGGRVLRHVGRHDQAPGGAGWFGGAHGALHQHQRRVLRTLALMPVQRTVGQGVVGQGQHGVPQGA
ncbi:hypothetical protein [Hydrogenophaga sp. SL48]|uniref:hypothetical protein n=1 Tax=Hydrogenophaga sp. SL48 TaxID=2806347 RepID=UPI00301A1620